MPPETARGATAADSRRHVSSTERARHGVKAARQSARSGVISPRQRPAQVDGVRVSPNAGYASSLFRVSCGG
jgi:hypothetical protein